MLIYLWNISLKKSQNFIFTVEENACTLDDNDFFKNMKFQESPSSILLSLRV